MFNLSTLVSSLSSTAPAHPFSLLESVGELSPAGWQLHKASKAGAEASVFVFDSAKPGNKERLFLAKNALKRSKTLRHPGLLSFVDGAENDAQVIIGTEPVTPLSLALSRDPSLADDANFLALGLYKIASAVKFLNADVQMTHGNIRMSSIYITKSGEWKLAGLDVACSLKDPQPLLVEWGSRLADSFKYAPPECANGWAGIVDNPLSALDSWGFGCLLYEVFNNTSLPSRDVLTNISKIPKVLVPHYKHLLNSNPKSRHDVATVFERCKSAQGGYFVNDFISVCLALEQFSIKESHEKDQFLNKLNNSLETFPSDFCKHKILPELIKALEFGGAGSKALSPILKIGNKLDTAEFESLLVPILIKMFALPDRAIRVSLCENMGGFIEKVNPKVLNEKIFPNLSTGFSDSNAVVRECTLRSVLLIVPKLNERIINNDLLRFLAKLQNDEEPGIRANTTICLGKLATSLNEITRKKILIPAFSRSLHDSFAPTRNAGLLALQATADYYSPMDVAQRIIPATSLLLLDPERSIRTQAFKNLDIFVKRLEKHSNNMPDPQEAVPGSSPVPVSAMGGGTSPATAAVGQDGWAGWAVGALSSTIARATTSTAGPTGTDSGTGAMAVRKSEDTGRNSFGGGASSNSSQPGFGTTTGSSSGLPPVMKPISASGSGSVGGMSLKPKAVQSVNVEDWNTDWEEKPKVATASVVSTGGTGWDDDWDSQPPKSNGSIVPLSPVSSFAGGIPSSISSFGNVGSGTGLDVAVNGGGSLADREAEKQRKREQLALLREQKKAAIAAKKMNQL
ncbi:armadillo-type protein [Obelidium mucronatum]|nr:armadillo-type protein [Obelidium mucronatum]KAI9333020.1 armadillo-type protein [Obelidium mucronatum]